MRKIIISESFKSEWQSIFLYLEENFEITVANRVNLELGKMLTFLSVFPEIGKKNLRDKQSRTFSFKRNVLVYSFQDTEIVFLKVINRRSIK